VKTVLTNAPEAYDYWDSIYSHDVMRKIGPMKFRVRVVRVPADNAQYQADRYRSGMYLVIEE
jgi:hypothetical protein